MLILYLRLLNWYFFHECVVVHYRCLIATNLLGFGRYQTILKNPMLVKICFFCKSSWTIFLFVFTHAKNNLVVGIAVGIIATILHRIHSNNQKKIFPLSLKQYFFVKYTYIHSYVANFRCCILCILMLLMHRSCILRQYTYAVYYTSSLTFGISRRTPYNSRTFHTRYFQRKGNYDEMGKGNLN